MDNLFMARAIQLSLDNVLSGKGGPFGAVIVQNGKIVAEGVNRLRAPARAFVVITHYQRLLDYIVPDVVHVLSRGRIVKTGGKGLALELEAHGYAEFQEEVPA